MLISNSSLKYGYMDFIGDINNIMQDRRICYRGYLGYVYQIQAKLNKTIQRYLLGHAKGMQKR